MNLKKNDHIVIIGGGFAGLRLIKALKNKPVRVTLIDKHNYHAFQPLFYQVASARLEPASISFPFRKILQRYHNIVFRMSEVRHVDVKKNQLITNNGIVDYDHLVIGTGCITNFFGNEGVRKHALTMKTMQDAIEIRNRILLAFESYPTTDSSIEKEALMNIVIVGGGASGVELAGAFAELKNNILPKDYPTIDFSQLKIIMVEGSAFTLQAMSNNAREKSRSYLEEMGVEIKSGTILESYDGTVARLKTGETILCKNLIWSAGVAGQLIDGVAAPENIIRNRYVVSRHNQIRGTNNIYAIGDVAYMSTEKYPQGHPQVANVAITQAANLGRNINRALKRKSIKEYEYSDKGSMATIGKHKAVVDLKFLKFQGFFAWVIWMILHLMLIISLRNKIIIFINWAWNYITKDTSLRLIFNTPAEANASKNADADNTPRRA